MRERGSCLPSGSKPPGVGAPLLEAHGSAARPRDKASRRPRLGRLRTPRARLGTPGSSANGRGTRSCARVQPRAWQRTFPWGLRWGGGSAALSCTFAALSQRATGPGCAAVCGGRRQSVGDRGHPFERTCYCHLLLCCCSAAALLPPLKLLLLLSSCCCLHKMLLAQAAAWSTCCCSNYSSCSSSCCLKSCLESCLERFLALGAVDYAASNCCALLTSCTMALSSNMVQPMCEPKH